jgi:putative ABC transport system permease protein
VTEQAHSWPVEVAAASLGVLFSAAFLALAISLSLGAGTTRFQVGGTTSLVTIQPGGAQTADPAGAAGRPGALTIADVDAIARAVPGVSVMSRVVLGASPLVVAEADPQALVQGVDPAYAQLWSSSVARGDFFSVQDATAANRVAVLGQTVADRAFPNGQSPIGQTIRIRNLPFTVVGVLASHVSLGAANTDNSVLVPFQTAQVRLFGTTSMYELVLQVPDTTQADLVTAQVQQVLRQRHKVGPGQADDFAVRTDSSASTTQPNTSALQILGRVVRDVQQYTCEAKALCRPSQQPQ